jgi:hypothetical protein
LPRAVLLLALLAGTAARAEVDVPSQAQCLLVIDGAELIRGPCTFTPLDADGSFTVAGLNGRYFAYVLIEAPGRAQGYWNGTPYADHAHDPLGGLVRDDACWINDRASVCAW